jgi:GAF domain-containing protein
MAARGAERSWFLIVSPRSPCAILEFGANQRAAPSAPSMTETLAHRPTASAEARSVCKALLQQSLALTGATLGNVQLVDWEAGELSIASQVGFRPDFLRFFARVKYRDSCACARALGTRAPVVISDVMSDAGFAPYRGIASRAGFRAVQSTPLLSSSSALVGIVSTHFPSAHVPTVRELASLAHAGRLAADAIIAQRARSRRMRLVAPPGRVKAEEYRQYAAECEERALHSPDAEARGQFVELAREWRELAEQIGEFLRFHP